jgi:hypothetical protein
LVDGREELEQGEVMWDAEREGGRDRTIFPGLLGSFKEGTLKSRELVVGAITGGGGLPNTAHIVSELWRGGKPYGNGGPLFFAFDVYGVGEMNWEMVTERPAVSPTWIEVGVMMCNRDRRVDERVSCERAGEKYSVDPWWPRVRRVEVGGDVVIGVGTLGRIMQMEFCFESWPLFDEVVRGEERSSRSGVSGVLYKVEITTEARVVSIARRSSLLKAWSPPDLK